VTEKRRGFLNLVMMMMLVKVSCLYMSTSSQVSLSASGVHSEVKYYDSNPQNRSNLTTPRLTPMLKSSQLRWQFHVDQNALRLQK